MTIGRYQAGTMPIIPQCTQLQVSVPWGPSQPGRHPPLLQSCTAQW